MEVKPGYKQTEIGVIPEEWEVVALGSVTTTVASGKSSSGVGQGTYPVHGSTGIIGYTERPEYEGDSILAARVGANAGKLNLVSGKYGVTDNTIMLRLRGGYSLAFVWRQLETKHLNSLVFGSGQPLITGSQLKALSLSVPPLPEQRAIATALSDVDGLLGGLDRLIAKKRALKQAAMQQLLTGQTRLPGFSGEWEETTFGNVVRHHAGNSTLIKGKLPSSEATGRFPAYSASGQDVWCDHFEHEGDAIVVSAVGSRCGKAFMASGNWCAIANTHVVWPNSAKLDTRFLAYFINDEDFWQKSGTGQPFVLFTKTFARPLRLPKLPEQTAIAEVLTEMDGELAVLEQRREKTRALKQAMMQELLTGKIRLL